MEKQQQPPVNIPMYFDLKSGMSTIWRRWFQNLKTKDDEIRKRPYKTYTADQVLTTNMLGRTIVFDTDSADLRCTLPAIDNRDLWAWINITRIGDNRLVIAAESGARIDNGSFGGTIFCSEARRAAANVTLQIINSDQWAITAGLGLWRVD